MHIYEQAVSTGLQTMLMLDIFVLFSLFLLLVGLLGLFQYVQRVSGSCDLALSKKLLQEWLEAHSLTLPDVKSVLAVLNQQLADFESEDLEMVEATKLLPQTQLPVFHLTHAELSTDNTDIILYCSAEWPTCLPGVCVEVREKGKHNNITCHFSIDWMTAQMMITLKDNNGELLLSYKNMQPFQMGVACMVIEGTANDPDGLAGLVADTLQLMLMNLSLDRVSFSPQCNHTPSTSSVTCALVSPADEISSPSHDKTEDHQSCDQDLATPSEVVTVEENESEIHGEDSKQTILTSNLKSSPLANSPISFVTEEVEPSLAPSSNEEEVVEEEEDDVVFLPHVLPSSSSSSSSSSNGLSEAKTDLINGSLLPLVISRGSESSESACPQAEISPNLANSPSWRRAPSYLQLDEIAPEAPKDVQKPEAPKDVQKPEGAKDVQMPEAPMEVQEVQMLLKTRSNSSDHLSRPNLNSPSGKSSLTLSMSGSEAESVYGADNRIPSTMVFEVEENGKVKHIVALNKSHAIRLRRRNGSAKKLHIYNDHSFLASKIKSKTDCAFCKDKINKLFGKQGYSCRDCGMVVHKECHYKVEEHCLSSTLSSMNLYVTKSLPLLESISEQRSGDVLGNGWLML